MLLWQGQKGRVDFAFSKSGQGAPPFDAFLAVPLKGLLHLLLDILSVSISSCFKSCLRCWKIFLYCLDFGVVNVTLFSLEK